MNGDPRKESKTGKSLICNPSLWLKVLSVQAGVLGEQCCQLPHHGVHPNQREHLRSENRNSLPNGACCAVPDIVHSIKWIFHTICIKFRRSYECLSTEGHFYFSNVLIKWNIFVNSPSIPAQSLAWRGNSISTWNVPTLRFVFWETSRKGC